MGRSRTRWAVLALVATLIGACSASGGQTAVACRNLQPAGSTVKPSFSVAAPEGWEVLDLSAEGLDGYATAHVLAAEVRSWLHSYVEGHVAGGMTWFAVNERDPRRAGGLGTHAEGAEFACNGLEDLGVLQDYTESNRKRDPHLTSALDFSRVTLPAGPALRLQYTQTNNSTDQVIVQYEIPEEDGRVYELVLLTHPDAQGPDDIAAFDAMLKTFKPT